LRRKALSFEQKTHANGTPVPNHLKKKKKLNIYMIMKINNKKKKEKVSKYNF
jgi:uncharacterized cupredoxin-like copper-binding protein